MRLAALCSASVSHRPSGCHWSKDLQLQREGQPVGMAVFPDAEHGIIEFDEAPDLARTRRKYAAGFSICPRTGFTAA
jgi:hypothetical protein